MPIYLHTGQPGAGKTLYTLVTVKKRAEAENREVFYHGINDLKLPWIPLEDPKKWHECPNGAIIVIDECQSTFRVRQAGAAVPEHVAAAEVHRHKGHDVYLITQHPMLLDQNIRRLIGHHHHVKRKFGFKTANVHQWDALKQEPDKTRTDSIVTTFNYPTDAFSYYKSAEVHTVKAKLPTRVKMLLLIPLLLAPLMYYSYSRLNPDAQRQRIEAQSIQQSASQNHNGLDAGQVDSKKPDYFADNTPRVAGLAYTAPKYDKVTQPVTAPYPAACMTMRGKCKCYSQQGTVLDTDENVCNQIVEKGFFVDFKTDVDKPVASQSAPERGKGVETPLQAPMPSYEHAQGMSAAASPES